MRIRLLIDVEMDASAIPDLAEEIAVQPVTTVRIEGEPSERFGRLMGAQPVEAE